MNTIKCIRERLQVTQAALGHELGCTQGNVYHYEQGQSMASDVAGLLIDFAKTKGLTLTLDHVYGRQPLPWLTPRRRSTDKQEA